MNTTAVIWVSLLTHTSVSDVARERYALPLNLRREGFRPTLLRTDGGLRLALIGSAAA